MALMSVNDDAEDFRSRPRWSAAEKMDAVLRLLRGESFDELSRELRVEAHRLAAWRDEFLGGRGRTSRAAVARVTRARGVGSETRNARSVS